MNANAYGGSSARVLEWVEIATAGGDERRPPTGARLRLPQLGPARGRGRGRRAACSSRAAPSRRSGRRSQEMRRRRHEAQPQGIRTFGSTFKNPDDPRAGERTAGMLLDRGRLRRRWRSAAPASRPSTRTSSRTPAPPRPPTSSQLMARGRAGGCSSASGSSSSPRSSRSATCAFPGARGFARGVEARWPWTAPCTSRRARSRSPWRRARSRRGPVGPSLARAPVPALLAARRRVRASRSLAALVAAAAARRRLAGLSRLAARVGRARDRQRRSAGRRRAAIEAALARAAHGMSTLDVTPPRCTRRLRPSPGPGAAREPSASRTRPARSRVTSSCRSPRSSRTPRAPRWRPTASCSGPAVLTAAPADGQRVTGAPARATSAARGPLRADLTVLGAAPAAMVAPVARVYAGRHGLTAAMRNGLLVYFGDAAVPHAKWLSLERARRPEAPPGPPTWTCGCPNARPPEASPTASRCRSLAQRREATDHRPRQRSSSRRSPSRGERPEHARRALPRAQRSRGGGSAARQVGPPRRRHGEAQAAAEPRRRPAAALRRRRRRPRGSADHAHRSHRPPAEAHAARTAAQPQPRDRGRSEDDVSTSVEGSRDLQRNVAMTRTRR